MLINDILDLSKIEAQKTELYLAETNLTTLLSGIDNICRMRAEQKGIGFEYLPLTTFPNSVMLDKKRLRQVLLNLLDNAIKVTSSGHVCLRVSFSDETSQNDRQEGKKVGIFRVEVADTGPGIASGDLEKIFMPFEQVGPKRYPGTGLGLAICQQIVRLMGGEIRVESEWGKGSTFWFEVQLPIVEIDESAATDFDMKIVGYKGPTRYSILVVDDKLQNRTVLIDMLTPLGFRILEAANGHEGVAMAIQMGPELIFMDIVMPGMSGIEATRKIRAAGLNHIPIIAVSASAFEEDRKQSIQEGCNFFLPKPVNLEALYTVLKHFLGLEWTYSDAPEQQRAGQAELAVPCLEALTKLHEMAIVGDIRGIRNQIQALSPEYKLFADKVRELAAKFKDKEIVELIERYI